MNSFIANILKTDYSTPSIDCVLSEWSAYGDCIEGLKTRTRTVITPASGGGIACGVLTESVLCDTTGKWIGSEPSCEQAPIVCKQYRLTVDDGLVDVMTYPFSYTNCAGVLVASEIVNTGQVITVCMDEDSFVGTGQIIVQELGNCP